MDDIPDSLFSESKSLSGSVVAGYRIGQLISSSDMGEVYLATQLSMNRKVAFKVLSGALTHDHEMIQTFLNEVQLLAQMEHPHIVTAIDGGCEDSTYYLVMTFVGGEDLANRIEHRGPMASRKAIETMQQVAKGLAYAWKSHKVLHRDIKPSNIMVTRDGMAKILDMGVSVQSYIDAGGVLSQDIVGTPRYLSPERIQGTGDATVRSEIYSLGATFYHVLTGHAPYHELSVGQILSARDLPNLPPACVANPDVDPAVSGLIEHTMMRHPNLRPGSWEEMLKLTEDVHENLVRSEAASRGRKDARLDFRPEGEKKAEHRTEAERQEQDDILEAARIRAAEAKRTERQRVHPMVVPFAVVVSICIVGTVFFFFMGKAASRRLEERRAPESVRRQGMNGMSHRVSEEAPPWQRAAEALPRSQSRLQAVRTDPEPGTQQESAAPPASEE